MKGLAVTGSIHQTQTKKVLKATGPRPKKTAFETDPVCGCLMYEADPFLVRMRET